MSSTTSQKSDDLTKLLQWHIDIGAHDALSETPINFFEARQVASQEASGPEPVQKLKRVEKSTTPLFTSDDQALTSAKELAASCQNLEDLENALMNFDQCGLKKTSQNLVFYDGNPKAKTLFLGEAPGADEDRLGKPFVGRSGKLLDKMLDAINLSRTAEDPQKSVCISNVIYWRPPGNRKPTDQESHLCLPFVEKMIEIINPEIIICLGATPMHRLIGGTQGILRARGRWQLYPSGDRQIPVLPTLHPAYLLRAPAQKKLSWQDFISLREKLDGI